MVINAIMYSKVGSNIEIMIRSYLHPCVIYDMNSKEIRLWI